MLLLRCKRCGNRMKYHPLPGGISGKRKKCVYCGASFKVSESIVRPVKG